MKILRGTVFGTIAYFLLGWLVWGILLSDYFKANMNSCAARPDGEMVWWALILSNLVFALVLTLILKWRGAKGVADGLTTGALIGFLFALYIDASFWSMTTNFNSLGVAVVDVAVNTLFSAVIGVVIVLTWGKEKKA